MEKVKICIVLLGANRKAVGGYKIMYEYANRFINEGYEVSILFLNDTQFKRYHFPPAVRRILVNIYTKIEPRWFKLNKKVRKVSNVQRGYQCLLKDVNVCIATSCLTVQIVQNLFPKIKKIYYIQDYEDWEMQENMLLKTYSLGMINIVISKWLKDIVDKNAIEPSILIKNPIDTNIYRIYNAIEYRNKYKIGLLYHTLPAKGFRYAYEAIIILKKRFPQLEVLMFGTAPKPVNLPRWIKYYRNASQDKTVQIYNEVSIFLCASVKEGYGLTGAESMACGAAFVSTEYDSVHEYAENNKNALLSPVCNVGKLVENVTRLIEDDELRIKLAYEGAKTMEDYSWDRALNIIKSLIYE